MAGDAGRGATLNAPTSLAAAHTLDAADPLRAFRERFAQPVARGGGTRTIYLCGHSLGLAPLAARDIVIGDMDAWERLGVLGHVEGARPWIDYAERLRPALAPLVGAQPADVLVANGLTVNLHLLLAGFYRPQGRRNRILIEAGAFSSDRHAVASQIQARGLDPAEALIEVAPPPGRDVLDPDHIDAAIAAAGDRLALVLWPGVQFRTGQAFDCARISRAAHAVGAWAGFDHAHAIGNLPIDVMRDDADFAAWCSYKYLNAGPGAVAGLFVHPRHAGRSHLAGWWGHDPATRFRMEPGFVAAPGAAGWALGTPPILSSAPLVASLALFAAAGIGALRRKSVALTGSLEALLVTRAAGRVQIVTPADPAQRGCQLSLRLRGPDPAAAARRAFAALAARDVVCDLREPDILRVAPVPLYNGFEDTWLFVEALLDALGDAP